MNESKSGVKVLDSRTLRSPIKTGQEKQKDVAGVQMNSVWKKQVIQVFVIEVFPRIHFLTVVVLEGKDIESESLKIEDAEDYKARKQEGQ